MSWRLLKNAVSLTHGSLCIIAMMKHGMSLLARLLLQSSVLRILSQGWKDVSDVRKIPERPKSRHNRSSNINSFFDADSLGSLFALGGLHKHLQAGLKPMNLPYTSNALPALGPVSSCSAHVVPETVCGPVHPEQTLLVEVLHHLGALQTSSSLTVTWDLSSSTLSSTRQTSAVPLP